MSDIADKSERAIIRAGINFQFLLVGPFIAELLRGAKNPETFGPGFCFVKHGAKDCCGALFISEIDGGIGPRDFWRLEYFFARNKTEAVVFEFDRWGKHFQLRRLAQLWQRRKKL